MSLLAVHAINGNGSTQRPGTHLSRYLVQVLDSRWKGCGIPSVTSLDRDQGRIRAVGDSAWLGSLLSVLWHCCLSDRKHSVNLAVTEGCQSPHSNMNSWTQTICHWLHSPVSQLRMFYMVHITENISHKRTFLSKTETILTITYTRVAHMLYLTGKFFRAVHELSQWVFEKCCSGKQCFQNDASSSARTFE